MNGLPARLGHESQGSGSLRGPGIDLRNILAPVDFSTASQHGLAFAAALAERFHSTLQVLHVVEPSACLFVFIRGLFLHDWQRQGKSCHQ